MRLRTRFVLLVSIGIAITLTLALMAARYVVTNRFADMERDNTQENARRAVSALYQDFTALNIAFGPEVLECGSFRWLQDAEGTHLEVNFDGPSFAALNISFIAFVTNPGYPPIGVGYDPETGVTLPLLAGFAEELLRDSNPIVAPGDEGGSFTGILMLPEHAFLVQSFPVAAETLQGPATGRAIFARLLDDAEVERLEEQTHTALSLVRWDDPNLPDDFIEARSRLSSDSPVVSREAGSNTVCGYGLVNDVYGQPALIMKATLPRDIYYQGQQTAYWLIVLLAAIALVLTVGMSLVIHRLILSRLLKLGRDINRMREAGDPSARIVVHGNDEVSALGEAINGMLASLDRSQRELSERDAEKRALLNAVPDLMFRVSADGSITDARAAGKAGLPPAKVRLARGRLYRETPAYEEISAEVVRRGLPLVKRALQTGETQTFEIQVPLRGDMAFYEARVAASRENEALVMIRDVTERKRAEMRLEFVSSHDALSGLHNRAYFESEFARMERAGGQFPVSVVMVDVDGLKAVNDTQGHVAGDALLRRTAMVLTATFRSGDVVSRIGGDEFAVLLPGADASVGQKALERLRNTLALHNSEHRGAPLSFSMGMASGGEGSQLTEIMREADNRMYQDKQAKKATARASAAARPVG